MCIGKRVDLISRFMDDVAAYAALGIIWTLERHQAADLKQVNHRIDSHLRTDPNQLLQKMSGEFIEIKDGKVRLLPSGVEAVKHTAWND